MLHNAILVNNGLQMQKVVLYDGSGAKNSPLPSDIGAIITSEPSAFITHVSQQCWCGHTYCVASGLKGQHTPLCTAPDTDNGP